MPAKDGTVTFVGALRQCGMTAPFVMEGAMNGLMFVAYVKQCLVPALKRGEIVLWGRSRVAEPDKASSNGCRKGVNSCARPIALR